MTHVPMRAVALISGRGSNLKALLAAQAAGTLGAEVTGVISSRADAPGLAHARDSGIETAAVEPRDYPDRATYDHALALRINAWSPDLVLLAGFMRILSDDFVERYRGRMLNIHPSLLPAYRGMHTHRRALADGARVHGCSVHFVTPALDSGPVILQARVPVLPDDTETSLADRVLEEEHRIYPLAVRWYAEGRLRLTDRGVELDGELLTDPVEWQSK